MEESKMAKIKPKSYNGKKIDENEHFKNEIAEFTIQEQPNRMVIKNNAHTGINLKPTSSWQTK